MKVKDVEAQNYAKYILREGQMQEKRELLSCLKTKIKLVNKLISI